MSPRRHAASAPRHCARGGALGVRRRSPSRSGDRWRRPHALEPPIRTSQLGGLVLVSAVSEPGLAAGVERGNRVLSIDGVPIRDWYRARGWQQMSQDAVLRYRIERSRRPRHRGGAPAGDAPQLLRAVPGADLRGGLAGRPRLPADRHAGVAAQARSRRVVGLPALLRRDGDGPLQLGAHLRRAGGLRAHAHEPAADRRHGAPPLHDLSRPSRPGWRAIAALRLVPYAIAGVRGARSSWWSASRASRSRTSGDELRARARRRAARGRDPDARAGALRGSQHDRERRHRADRRAALAAADAGPAARRRCSCRSRCRWRSALVWFVVFPIGWATGSSADSSSTSAASRARPPPTARPRSRSPGCSRC